MNDRNRLGQRVRDWLYTRWLELRLGWLSVKKARLEYELRKLRNHG